MIVGNDVAILTDDNARTHALGLWLLFLLLLLLLLATLGISLPAKARTKEELKWVKVASVELLLSWGGKRLNAHYRVN